MSRDQEEGFTKYFEELESPLIAYAYQILKDYEEARDQVQEAFKRMISKSKLLSTQKRGCTARYAIFALATFASIKEFKRKRGKTTRFFGAQIDGSDHSNNPAEKLERSEK